MEYFNAFPSSAKTGKEILFFFEKICSFDDKFRAVIIVKIPRKKEMNEEIIKNQVKGFMLDREVI